MVGVVNTAEERAPSIEGGWRGKARSIICLHGSFEMTARLDADELTRAFDRDPKLANARGWALANILRLCQYSWHNPRPSQTRPEKALGGGALSQLSDRKQQ